MSELAHESASRELKEETRNAVRVDVASRPHITFKLLTTYKDSCDQRENVMTEYSVSLVDITGYGSMQSILRAFRLKRNSMHGVYDENSEISFDTLEQFTRRRLWPFIRWHVLANKSFGMHCKQICCSGIKRG